MRNYPERYFHHVTVPIYLPIVCKQLCVEASEKAVWLIPGVGNGAQAYCKDYLCGRDYDFRSGSGSRISIRNFVG